ncbi:MAG TPA: ABC transporter permease [Candidatus Thermoplasmatota archaeon]|nr:ABC transporter permease [Candidatus Thermoplasmatota archaeon]
MGYLQGYRVHPKLALRAWQREVTLYKRIWPSTILSTLLDPIMYLLALGFGLGAYVGSIQGRPYLEFIAPGLVASSVMYASIFEAAWNSYVRIFVERSYESMMATPAELEDVVAGEALWGATRATIYSVVMLVVLTGFGLIHSWWALLVPPVAFLAGLAFFMLGISYTVTCRHMDQLTFLFTLGVTPMFLFSGIFFPLEGLPQAVQAVAWLSPLYHLVAAVRALAFGAVGLGTLGHVAWLLGALTLAWGLPSAMLRRKLRT